MGYPALGQFAEVAGVQSFDLKNLSDNQKVGYILINQDLFCTCFVR